MTLLTSGVFLVVGAILMAVTYALVAATLPLESPVQALLRQEIIECQAQQGAAAAAPATSNGHPLRQFGIPVDKAFCNDVIQKSVGIGVNSERSTTLHNLLLYSVLGLMVTTVIAAGAAWILAGRALRPLRQITDAAGRASRATLGERIELPARSGELKSLADTFDEMLDRLDAAFAAQERFVADASHELRTPITTLRAVVDVYLAKQDISPEQLTRMGTDIRGLLDQAESLIAALLLLSRSDSRMTASEPLDLAAVVSETLNARGGLTTVDRDLAASPIRGDRLLVERAVANLVDNAVLHNDDRKWARIVTFSGPTESALMIENSGPAIAPLEADQLFRPFYRAAARTGDGHGLGLAIVRSVVLAHGGRCEAKPRADGGLAVTIVFPSCKEKADELSGPSCHAAGVPSVTAEPGT